MTEETTATQIVREDPEPLRMTKRRVQKEDGRYLIYYEFEQGPESAPRGRAKEESS